jgi:NAD(P)-dependent dehydrogenase (short-subunit alcohol dehydrogenase family)
MFDTLGDVGVLVNNAGLSTSAKLESTTLDDWNRNIQLNATAPFLCTKAVLRSMRARGQGRIITIASTAALEGARFVAAYTASKHAVLGMMKVLQAELHGSQIAAASVCPTFVRSDMTDRTISNIAARTRCTLQEATIQLEALTPYGRLVEPAEVADSVLRLLNRSATDMNGGIDVVDGRP